MANFNLHDYEPVQDRIGKFYDRYEDGRIITEMIQFDGDIVIFRAVLYKSGDDFDRQSILTTGWAQEKIGQGYVNKTSALENCETSAIGRALANIGLHGDKRASREEMIKVEKDSNIIDNEDLFNELSDKIEMSESVQQLVKLGEEIKKSNLPEERLIVLRSKFHNKMNKLTGGKK